eukprot:CAMPEP_0195521754 /NCGR_PEP_ID=MMETSP0794_2-20130614/19299_1 /TAXON_ID=515487 /ORGANISM="Stephanopyxis turris, Strain CCMP 815" /LENGTH=407 /DNA_ID=CAMNT_0040651373 /DNA_START=61 /DNA_END=1281 /DNA_ORIENTATION=-
MASQTYPLEFFKAIPKTDLHVHLDGSVRISTVIEIAKKDGLELPYYTVEELREHVFKKHFESLEDYLFCFKYTTMVMQSPENLERVAYEFAVDNYEEGVRYFEVRFGPQLHARTEHGELDICNVIRSVNRGLERATKEYNDKIELPDEPGYKYGIIVSALRFFTADFSEYFKSLINCHKHEPLSRIYGLASMALVVAAVEVRNEGVPVVALDIAGAELGYPASHHIDAYRFAHKKFLETTCHAGEGYGPKSIFQAVTDLHAHRIGHGYHLFSEEMVAPTETFPDPKTFVKHIVQHVAQRRITLEVCLSSNLGTMPGLKLENHNMRRMLEERISVTVCTDNRLVSNTTTVKELCLASKTFKLSPKQLKDIVITGFKRSFYNGPYTEKRAYVRKAMDYYDQIASRYGVK